ncbi:MAG: DUF6689 family protein [Candidatus Eisenbacteria bacterium]
MRLSFAVGIVLLLVLVVSAYADFSQTGAIPSPWPPAIGGARVSGLSSAGDDLFAVVATQWKSYLYHLAPDSGDMLRQAKFNHWLPGCPGQRPQFTSGTPLDLDQDLYLVGDACGELLEIVFGVECSYISAYYHLDGVELPSGLVFDGDTLYVLDWDDNTLVKVVGTAVIDEYSLPGIDGPTGLALYRGNLFVVSSGNDSTVFEITKQGALVEAHSVQGLAGVHPYSLTFHNDLLYIGSEYDSILIFEEEGIWVPGGDDVPVEVVPGELTVNFDGVAQPGWLYVDVYYTQTCPAPAQVQLFPPFYDLTTTVQFTYVASTELTFTDSFLPPEFDVSTLRIFRRPSGPCLEYVDVTVEEVEILETFRSLMRTQSEDDEFSVFALGIDLRRPRAVVELKFTDVRNVIVSNVGVIPPAVFDEITAKLDDAETAYYRGSTLEAEALVQEIADIVRDTPAIPHTYDGMPGSNVAGGIIARSHTLAFSLRFSDGERVETLAEIKPYKIILGLESPWLAAYIEVPEGFDASQVDASNIYLDGEARAVPDSVLAVDYDSDGELEVRALFVRQQVENLFDESGPVTVSLTGFVDGFELGADPEVTVFAPLVEIMGEEPLEGGRAYSVRWSVLFEEPTITYAVDYALDGGLTWVEIVEGLTSPCYLWQVPDVETDAGMLRVHVLDAGVEFMAFRSGTLTITSLAGLIDGVGGHTDRLAISPNPSSSSFRIHLAPAGDLPISVKIYSVTGELVRTLVENEVADGSYSLTWDGANANGIRVAAGTYFMVLTEGEHKTARKLILQR